MKTQMLHAATVSKATPNATATLAQYMKRSSPVPSNPDRASTASVQGPVDATMLAGGAEAASGGSGCVPHVTACFT